MKATLTSLVVTSILTLAAAPAAAQWNPSTGDWLKSDETDLRVMSWNVQDTLCSTETKEDIASDWNAIVRIVAAMRPDVLILQECGDNSGNGTGGGVDSVSTLNTVMELFVSGGTDPFRGGAPVTSYVQLFTGTDYDLPHIYVSEISDGFNRNVILSRYPFADLNGGGATYSNFVLQADAYQDGGLPGIRGQQYAEIDLPDEIYAGDVVVANSHLKAGGSSSDFNDRMEAALNIAYFIDYYYNGAGSGVSDPNNKIILPTEGSVLDENTPVIWGGDLNQTPGVSSPATITTTGGGVGGTDGTDRDRTDASFDSAVHPITGEVSTQGSNSKLDYLCWQDSITTARREFIFRTNGSGMTAAQLPSPVDTYPIAPLAASSFASDHRPVIVDFILPAAPEPTCTADLDDSGSLNFGDVTAFLTLYGQGSLAADFDNSGSLNFGDVTAFLTAYAQGCP
jgi:endonuclease/exonuclease/phosphatase family metal-dependent hydrolase